MTKGQCNLYLEDRVQRIGREDAVAKGIKFSRHVANLILEYRKFRLENETGKQFVKEDKDGIK